MIKSTVLNLTLKKKDNKLNNLTINLIYFNNL